MVDNHMVADMVTMPDAQFAKHVDALQEQYGQNRILMAKAVLAARERLPQDQVYGAWLKSHGIEAQLGKYMVKVAQRYADGPYEGMGWSKLRTLATLPTTELADVTRAYFEKVYLSEGTFTVKAITDHYNAAVAKAKEEEWQEKQKQQAAKEEAERQRRAKAEANKEAKGEEFRQRQQEQRDKNEQYREKQRQHREQYNKQQKEKQQQHEQRWEQAHQQQQENRQRERQQRSTNVLDYEGALKALGLGADTTPETVQIVFWDLAKVLIQRRNSDQGKGNDGGVAAITGARDTLCEHFGLHKKSGKVVQAV